MPAHASARTRGAAALLRRGDVLHKYRIEKLLGAGAFARVYRAYDIVEGLHVALKVFAPPAPEVTQSTFRHEVRVISRLDHKNIMRLKTAEILGGKFVMISELGERTLLDAFTRPRSVRYAIHVLEQVLEGLACAHASGVIHRDVKPENILIWRDGRVKIADFGVSRLIDQPVTHTTATGTPSYRAPEQAYGRPTFASDVFAVALVFYEMVTRTLPRWPLRWPFERHEIFDARVPPALVRVIRRAVTFDLEHRYRDAGTMLRAVRAAVPELAKRDAAVGRAEPAKRLSWRQYRQREFEKRFERHLQLDFRCHRCSGALSEFMRVCPWCGFRKNSFAGITRFPGVCNRCEHGVHEDWKYCAWCYGPGFGHVSHVPSRDARYGGRCSRCGEGRLLPHMQHCPWCNARVRPWRSRLLTQRCVACANPVADDYWEFCAWCGKGMQSQRRRNGRRKTG